MGPKPPTRILVVTDRAPTRAVADAGDEAAGGHRRRPVPGGGSQPRPRRRIKQKDGTIGEKYSYGNDPTNIPG